LHSMLSIGNTELQEMLLDYHHLFSI